MRGGTSRANVEATTAELYDFACPSFTGEVITVEQVPPFPRGDAYLKALWQHEGASGTLFRITPLENDENDPILKQIWRIIREGDGNRGPGYDQITYRIFEAMREDVVDSVADSHIQRPNEAETDLPSL